MSSTYTASHIRKADRLYDEHSLREISEKTGIPYGTLSSWSRKGWISTDTNHCAGPIQYDWDTIERADRLYDRMPTPAISEVLEVPLSTLSNWKDRGWITTERDWHREAQNGVRKKSPLRAANLVHEQGLTQKEAAEKMDVHETTIGRYLKDYRKGRVRR
jgi:uncharacterized protein YjcR